MEDRATDADTAVRAKPRSPLLAAMRGEVPGAIWPPLFSNRQATLAALILQLDATQWADTDDIVAGQFRQLRALAEHGAAHSPRFRSRLQSAGLAPTDLSSRLALSSLPILTRRELQRDLAGARCEVLPRGHLVTRAARTSGSTGEPVVTVKTDVSRLHFLGMTIRYNLWQEEDFDGRLCIVRAEMDDLGHRATWGGHLAKFFGTGPSLRIDVEMDVRRQADLIADFQPTSLQTYPSNVAALMNEFEGRGIHLPNLTRVRTVGETATPSLRAAVRERLGAEVADCYSSVEIGYIALDCPSGSGLYHVMAEGVLVEIINDKGEPCVEGELGRVVITDLQNYATPLIRYEIGDYAETGPPCPCGRGLPTLRRIAGRTRNMITHPNGGRHWPLTGFKEMRSIGPISQYQLVQHRIDMVEVRLVTEAPLDSSQEQKLRAHIQDALHYPYEICFSYFEGRLPLGSRGKFEEVLNLVEPPTA